MKVDIYRPIMDALEENGIKIKAIERDNTCVHFELDFSEHDKMVAEEKDSQIRGLKRQIENLESIIADGKKPDISISENGVSIGCECAGYHLAKEKIAELERENNSLKERFSLLRTRCTPGIEKDFDKWLYGKLAIVGCNEEFVDIQKYADGDDLYSREVRNLISEGGIKRLIGQYRNISERLDKISAENKELKQRIAELESEEGGKLPFDALETANYLINATYERETSSLERAFAKVPDKVNDDRYTVDELEQIAEHLLVYCKHNKECEE